MKYLCFLLISGLLIFNHIYYPPSGWISTNGPYGGYINALVKKDACLFSLVGFLVYRSDDNGRTWNYKNEGIKYLNTQKLVASDKYLFALTLNGIYYTINNGESWSMLNEKICYSEYLDLTVKGNLIFIVSKDGDILFSSDFGKTWSDKKLNPRNTFITTLLSSGNNLIALQKKGEIILSSDNGNCWKEILPGYNVLLIHPVIDKRGLLFVSTKEGVFRSFDDGAHFEKTNIALNMQESVICFTSNKTSIYAATANNRGFYADPSYNIYETTNNGNDWTKINNFSINSIGCISSTDQDIMIGTFDQGILKLSKNKNYLYPANIGIRSTNVLDITACGGCIFAAAEYGQIFKSTDKGRTWVLINEHLPQTSNNKFAVIGDTIFVCNYFFGIYKSTNLGRIWTKERNNLSRIGCYSLLAKDNDLYVGTRKGIYKSTDIGKTWNCLNKNLPNNGNVVINPFRHNSEKEITEPVHIPVLCTDGKNIYAGSYGSLFFSSDNGQKWIEIPTPEKIIIWNVLSATDKFLLAGNTEPGCFGLKGDIFVLTKNGDQWSPVKTSLESVDANKIICVNNTFYAATNEGLFFSNNAGATWQDMNLVLPTNGIKSIYFEDNYLYVGTNGYGVWKKALYPNP